MMMLRIPKTMASCSSVVVSKKVSSCSWKTVSSASTSSFSRRSLSSSSSSSSPFLPKYGLGGHHWRQFDPNSYKELIHEALTQHHVNYFEVAGQEGGDVAMVGAMQSAMERSPHLTESLPSLTITTRIGYRTLQQSNPPETSTHTNTPDEQPPPPLKGDVAMTEEGEDETIKSSKVVHNLSSDYIRSTVETSPLLELREFPNVRLVYLIQNPEVQILELLKEHPNATFEERQAYIQQTWQPALEALQDLSSSSLSLANISSFGVVSNGLGIPPEMNHPMHLSSDLIVNAVTEFDKFNTVQLPINLLERHGWNVAKDLHATKNANLDIIAMRPLTCHPDLGTGTGHPFRLVDYELPMIRNTEDDQNNEAQTTTSTTTTQYTHEMTGIPSLYHLALQTAVSHFDAEEILEAKMERDLTVEERETLDGCKLVQSMIHDLDADLEHIRSFAAHEEELYGRIIPLLYDTFEAMDDRTSDVLQAYFAAYAVAVRYSIAKTTRRVLKEGEGNSGDSSSNMTYPDIPDSMTLQEYALRHMLAEPAMSRLVIGASTLEDFRRQMDLMKHLTSDDAPLDAIAAANEWEAQEKVKDGDE